MRLKRVLPFLLIALVAGGGVSDRLVRSHSGAAGPRAESEAGRYPNDWFMAQRAFPFERVPQEKWEAAFDQARADRAALASSKGNAMLSGPAWTQAGPYNIGGRITAITAAPGGDPAYFGAAGGGVFKSTNQGVNWTAVFDGMGVFSIGALAMDPTNSNIVMSARVKPTRRWIPTTADRKSVV